MGAAGQPQSAALTAVTINVHGRAAGWSARRRLLLDELAALDPDVASLQELRTFPSQGQWIARSLNARLSPTAAPFRVLTARKRRWRSYESIGLLTRLRVASADVIPLGTGGRVAIRAALQAPGGGLLDFYATHFQHGPAELARMEATRVLLERIANRGVPSIIAGDLNAGPGSEPMRALLSRLRSAYATVHGEEPDRTVPTDTSQPGAVLDYILVSREIEVLAASRAFERDARGRTASDHFGLAATVSIAPPKTTHQRTSR